MKIADLYIRVSTDEQADKGYSQRSQEELLRKYCDINGISIGLHSIKKIFINMKIFTSSGCQKRTAIVRFWYSVINIFLLIYY